MDLVNKVDDIRIDHVGWRLWDAAAIWKEKFAAGMIAAGHEWYGEARSSVIPYIAMTGTRQSDIVAKMGLSKQAVQQLIVDLESAGIVYRKPDPDDRRGKIVLFTDAGIAAQRDSIRVKREVEGEFRTHLGQERFDMLYDLLQKIGDIRGK